MCIPIAHALSWPERIESGAITMDLAAIARLDFEQPDMPNLPCLSLARQVAEAGGSAPAVLNAANEIAVAAFLDRKIPFTAIPEVIAATLETIGEVAIDCVDSVLNIDNEARAVATARLESCLL